MKHKLTALFTAAIVSGLFVAMSAHPAHAELFVMQKYKDAGSCDALAKTIKLLQETMAENKCVSVGTPTGRKLCGNGSTWDSRNISCTHDSDCSGYGPYNKCMETDDLTAGNGNVPTGPKGAVFRQRQAGEACNYQSNSGESGSGKIECEGGPVCCIYNGNVRACSDRGYSQDSCVE